MPRFPRPCHGKPTSLANQPTVQVSRVIHKFLEGETVRVAVPENAGLTFLRGPRTACVFITLMLLVWPVEVLNILIQHGGEPFFHRFGELLNNPFTVSRRNAKGSLLICLDDVAVLCLPHAFDHGSKCRVGNFWCRGEVGCTPPSQEAV